MFDYTFILVFSFLGGVWAYSFNYYHLLNSLLSLEFMGLCLFFYMEMYFHVSGGVFFFCLFYLVVLVVEGVVGLSVLISLVSIQSFDRSLGLVSLLC